MGSPALLLSTRFLRVFDTPWLLSDTLLLEHEGPHLVVQNEPRTILSYTTFVLPGWPDAS